MTDNAVIEYRKRREERLAARGIKPRQYRRDKDAVKLTKKMAEPRYNTDAPDEEEPQQNNGRRGGGSHGGGHGNTRLPFGLCKKYGIEIGDDWEPRDAWDALAGKGITPASAYRKLSAGEEITPDVTPEPPHDPVKKLTESAYGGAEYEDLHGSKRSYMSRGSDPWLLHGKLIEGTGESSAGYVPKSLWKSFKTKTDMFHYLKERGVEEFSDPETGELINPKEMELPRMLFKEREWDSSGFAEAAIGMKKGRYAVIGTDFDGKKKTLVEFRSLEEAEKWLAERGVSEEDIKLSPALKKREKERVAWLASDKKEYIEIDGKKYGDLKIEHGDYSGRWVLTGQSEDGEFQQKSFRSRAALLSFLKDEGVEVVREEKEKINPKEYEVPPTVAVIDDEPMQKLEFIRLGAWDFYLCGYDLDGNSHAIAYSRGGDTVESFKERIKERYGVFGDVIEASDDVKAFLEERTKSEEEQDRRRKEFKEKAVWVDGSKYADVRLKKTDGAYMYELTGYDSFGKERMIRRFSDMGEASVYLEREKELDPASFIRDEEVQADWDKLEAYKKEFDTKKITVGGYEYADLEVVRERDEYRLVGYDREGKRRRLTTSGDMDDIVEEAKKKGVDIKDCLPDEEIRKEYEDYERRVREFEEKAIQVGAGRYSDVEIVEKSAGKYVLIGYDKRGRRQEITYARDIGDVVEEAESYGLDPGKYAKSESVAEAYEDFKRVRAEFEEKSKPFGSARFMDMELEYEPASGWYKLMGTDIKGRRSALLTAKKANKLEEELKARGGEDMTIESLPKSEGMQRRETSLKRAKDAVASGNYFDLGVEAQAYKDIRVDRDEDGVWHVMATDLDGEERMIASKGSWDEAVSVLEDKKATKYSVKDGDKDLGRPARGMHHVIMMRKPGGRYAVLADTEVGSNETVFEGDSEDDCRKFLRESNVHEGGIKTRGMNPNDDVPRTHTAKSLAKFDSHRMKAIEGSFIDDMTQEEKTSAADMLREIFTQGAYRCARSTKSFGGIIENGYKSQIETGKGGYGAAKDKDARKRCSQALYGHDGMDDTEYEKCGYLGLSDDKDDYDFTGIPGYGGSSPCVYTFRKDHMQDRVSYTMGDSLNTWYRGYMKCAGYAGENPTIEGMTAMDDISDARRAIKAYQRFKRGEISFRDMFKEVRYMLNNSYIELQYNGPVTVEDIEKVTFTSQTDLENAFNYMGAARRKRVIKKLQDNSVQLLYRTRRGEEFKDAWEFLRTRYAEDFKVGPETTAEA